MKHILIVDDDIHINKMLDEVLVHERYMVSHAYSGTEALLFLADTKPDLILLDLMLPGLSGEELLPQISDIPIIVMSAKVDVEDKVSLLLGGAVDYVTKPFDTKELLARITVALRVKTPSLNRTLEFEDITLDTFTYEVFIEDKKVKLTMNIEYTEHNDGTIRNKIIVGQKRETIYLSNMVTCSIIAITMCIVFFVPYLSVGIPLLGFFVADMKMIVMIGITVLVLSVTFASLFTLVAMLSQNKAIIAVACILFSFGLLFAGAMCNRMLDAPKTIPAYSIGENGENTAQEMENPKYLDGTKREIVQFIYDVNPGGQAIQCSTMQVVNLTRLPIYSLVIVILTTGAGVWIFKKKDLK